MSCDQLTKMMSTLGSLAYQLQASPQGFGQKIIAFQQTIAQQEQELKKGNHSAEIIASLKHNREELDNYMTVVRWLESPES